jgi:serine protease AprX
MLPKGKNCRWAPGKSCFVALALLGTVLLSGAELSAQEGSSSSKGEKYWIFFNDKGSGGLRKTALAELEQQLLPKARSRRAKVLRNGMLVDYTDFPLWKPYTDELQRNGIKVVNRSRWLNAVSAFLDAEQLQWIGQQPFVLQYPPVGKFKRQPEPEGESLSKSSGPSSPNILDYGNSLTQNQIISVPQVHQLGFFGQGILIALLDTGFRLRHEAFDQLDVIAKYDFINKDTVVENESGQDVSSQDNHGTMILSILAGYGPGNLIGPAFKASFLLAKTEYVPTETPIEEDYWIAAAEWADSLGADIISSSLGYTDWYTYADMNGNTTPITIAADLAVKKGIVVMIAAGNDGAMPWHYISAPADGDSVIAVGAVNAIGAIASFSSRGPTSDGRIKPDLVTMGIGTRCVAIPTGEEIGTSYTEVSGTSAACPLAAGAAALILSAHPELTPIQLREALLGTADRSFPPDNVYGYGLVNALAAINYWGAIEEPPEDNRLIGSYPNPFIPARDSYASFVFDVAESATVTIEVYNVLGQIVVSLTRQVEFPGNSQRWSWDGRDEEGRFQPSGIYFCKMRIGNYSKTIKMILLQ